jgi:hypothetical protein
MPADLTKKIKGKYEQYMEALADLQRGLTDKLKDTSILYSAVPLAGLFEVEANVRAGELPPIIHKLARSSNPEIIKLANNLNKLGRRADAKLFKAGPVAATAKEPESVSNIIARLAAEHLPQNLAASVKTVELMEAWPRNEFKILTDSIYSYSSLSRAEIEEEVDRWSYQQKTEALQAALSSNETEILSKLHYRFDVTIDHLLLDDLVASGIAVEIKAQPATPRYGYEVPHAVDEVGITDEYLACFDKSLELFSSLQAAGREDLAPLATLVGHKGRFHIISTYESLKNGRSSGSSELQKLLEEMIEQISEHHPLVGSQLSTPSEPQKAKPAEVTKPKSKRSRRRGGKSKKS